jgi:S-adenosylmethionine hydrolase
MAAGPIGLMTDFGMRDPFAGIMTGVILRINHDARIVDVCYDIAPGDIQGAAFSLSMAFPYFPLGTIFTVVVDPGVGSPRRAIAVEIGGQVVVCPDNGVLTWVLQKHPDVKAVELTSRQYFLTEVSDTFHGRDIFAPVAAYLSKGVALDELGPQISDLTTFPIPRIVTGDRSIQGEVIYVDRFGNLVTNISREQLAPWQGKSGFGPVRVHVGSAEIQGIERAYSDVPKGRSLALFGSMGLLEIAVNGGSAIDTLGAKVGAHILVYRLPE